jgi:hypothetical protein
MRFSNVLPVAAALSAHVALAQRDSECEDITIRESNPVIDCEVITGDVTVDESVSGELFIEGPEQIRGDLIITNVTNLVSLTSNSINAIGGTFELQDLNIFSTLNMPALRSINEISFIKLPQLGSLTFGTSGVTRASTVRISDTFLSDLSGLKLATVRSFQIDNNSRLQRFSSDLVNITEFLQINANGNNMSVSMLNLETADRITINSVSEFEVPSLEKLNGSLTFDGNPNLESFAAPNLTTVGTSITLTSNRRLANISFPALTEISNGDLTVIENAELSEIQGFPELTRIYGGMQLAGNFESADFPALEQVRGAVNVTSSTQDTSFCDTFTSLESVIEGSTQCLDNVDDAVSEENGGTGSGGSGGNDDDNNDDDEDAAGIVAVNMAILGVVAIAGLVQLL